MYKQPFKVHIWSTQMSKGDREDPLDILPPLIIPTVPLNIFVISERCKEQVFFKNTFEYTLFCVILRQEN